MEEPKRITPPLSDDDIASLVAGDRVLISGVLYFRRMERTFADVV